jgi:hypothetical protein
MYCRYRHREGPNVLDRGMYILSQWARGVRRRRRHGCLLAPGFPDARREERNSPSPRRAHGLDGPSQTIESRPEGVDGFDRRGGCDLHGGKGSDQLWAAQAWLWVRAEGR